MNPFTVDLRLTRVVFGAGCFDELGVELEKLGLQRAMIVSTPGRAAFVERARVLLRTRVVGTFDSAIAHPSRELAAGATGATADANADCIVALGGGAAIGVAKAVALELPVQLIAVPTTYSGSEMTPIWGLTHDGRKEIGRDHRVQPRLVVYDPLLTTGLSQRASVASGMNAIAHCTEALYATDANPLTSLIAEEGIRVLAAALPTVHADPTEITGRTSALYGAWLAGLALGQCQMALHHRLCHMLGGTLGLPHADTHAVLLPYTTAYNRNAARDAMARVAHALGAADAPSALLLLAESLGAPRSLSELGMREEDLEQTASLVADPPFPNPRTISVDSVRELLTAAFRGRREYVLKA